MKLVALFLLLGSSLLAQKAVYSDYSPTVKGVTIGGIQCFFWFHASVYESALAAGWEFESACYNAGKNVTLDFAQRGEYKDGGYVRTDAYYIRYIVQKSFDNHDPSTQPYNFELSARGPDDTQDFHIRLTI